jgi:hypothetical protein
MCHNLYNIDVNYWMPIKLWPSWNRMLNSYKWSPSIGAPRNFLWGGGEGGGGWPWGYIQFMFHFKNYVMKLMSKCFSQHLVRLQEKLKVTQKGKKLHTCTFLLYFSIFQYTSHQPISVGDLVWSINHVKPLISLCLQNLCFLNFALGWGLQPSSHPLGCINESKHPLLLPKKQLIIMTFSKKRWSNTLTCAPEDLNK